MRKLISSLLVIACWVGISAHNPKPHQKINTFGYKADIDSASVYESFQKNSPEDFQTQQGIPNAAIIGKGGKFIIGVGGYIKAVVGMDFGHPISTPDEFITSQIPMGSTEGDGAKFNLSAQQSHLFLNFVILPGTDNEVGAFISANFLNNYVPVLQFAYLKYRGFQGGYDYSLFSDPACSPPAVDYQGPSSNTANPVAGISYSRFFGNSENWELSIGAELPQTSFTTVEGRTKSVNQRVPDIPLAAKYSWNEGNSWVRASAMLRNLYFRDLAQSKNIDKFGYGFQLSGAWNFLEKFTLFYQGVCGKGIASMIQDTLDEGLDMTPSPNGNTLDPLLIWGGFGSLQYDINERLCCSATYSHVRTYARRYSGGETPWSDLYKYAQYFSTNFFVHVTSYFDVGLEYIYGRRADYSGEKASDNRLQAAFQLSF